MLDVGDLSAIHIVEKLINEALVIRASDIHLESICDGVRVRLRIDGLLYDKITLRGEVAQQLLARIKVLAHIDLAERRLPHDGKFRFITSRGEIDMRVSTFPCVYGEKIVIRILDKFATALELNQLGFLRPMLEQFQELFTRQNSCLLVTGPTGSGKTTTLYAALTALQSPEKNMVTLEDPIEYCLDGVTQSQVHHEIGFTFAKAIRSVLRQDPDIILVGEIRDTETARVAIQAALTGHFVMSTLHTNDAPSAIIRLLDMGVEPFLMKATLAGILAQRLGRKLCLNCRYEDLPHQAEKELIQQLKLPLTTLYRAQGCSLCSHLGYKGRVGVFQLLIISPSLRSCINNQADLQILTQQALADGMRPLLADAVDKVAQGIMSFSEMVRTVL